MVVSIKSRLTLSRIAGPCQSSTPGMAHSAVLPERVGPTIATDVTAPGRPWRISPVAYAHQRRHPRLRVGAHRRFLVATSTGPTSPTRTGPEWGSGPAAIASPGGSRAGMGVHPQPTTCR